MIPLKFRFILVDQLGGLVQQRLFFLGPTGKKKVTFFLPKWDHYIIIYCSKKKTADIQPFCSFIWKAHLLRLWGRGRKLHRQLPRIFLGAVLGLRALWNPATVFGSEQVQCSPFSDICPKLGWRNMKLSGKTQCLQEVARFLFGRLPQFCQNDDMRFWYPAMLLLLYLHAGLACSQKELCSL